MNKDYNAQDIMKDKLGYLTSNQILSIYKACNGHHRNEILVRLLWMSGRRISEVLQLKAKDIDMERCMITWNILKKKTPVVSQKTIDRKTMELVMNYVGKNALGHEDYVLHSYTRDKPLSRQRASIILRRLGEKAGIVWVGSKKLHPHHFRHSRAMRLAKEAKSPADIKNIQRILEHSSLAMTEHYLGFLEEDTRELMEIE